MIVSVFDPSATMPSPVEREQCVTEVPDVVCEISSVPPAPGVNVTLDEFAIEPLPLSASVAPASIWVALV